MSPYYSNGLRKMTKTMLLRDPSDGLWTCHSKSQAHCAQREKSVASWLKKVELKSGMWCWGEVLGAALDALLELTELWKDQRPGTQFSIQCTTKARPPVITAIPCLCTQTPQALGPVWVWVLLRNFLWNRWALCGSAHKNKLLVPWLEVEFGYFLEDA